MTSKALRWRKKSKYYNKKIKGRLSVPFIFIIEARHGCRQAVAQVLGDGKDAVDVRPGALHGGSAIKANAWDAKPTERTPRSLNIKLPSPYGVGNLYLKLCHLSSFLPAFQVG